MNKNMNKILKEIERIGIEINENADLYQFENLTYSLEDKGLISFAFEEQNSSSECYLNMVYYEEKIRKTIIFEYDVRDVFEDNEEFAKYLVQKEKELKEFRHKNFKYGG